MRLRRWKRALSTPSPEMETEPKTPAAKHVVNRKDAEAQVQKWFDRHNPAKRGPDKPNDANSTPANIPNPAPADEKPAGCSY